VVTREIPINGSSPQESYTLQRNISAIQVLPAPDGGMRLGTILQLPEGTQVRICGEGFNERTVKVSSEGGNYFIFLEDVEPDRTFAARTYHASVS
jgi:hypothetical protein